MPVRIQKPAVNIREKLAELERPIGVNGAALMATNTPQEAFSLIGAGRKNLIINGDFKIWQRSTGPAGAGLGATRIYAAPDRFFKFNTADAMERIDVSTNNFGGVTGLFNYACRISGTQAGRIIGQCIEGPVSPGPNRQVTVSAWVRFSSQPTNCYITSNRDALLGLNNFSEFYGGGADTKAYINPDGWPTIYPGDNIWFKIQRTFTPPSPHLGIGIGIQPTFSSNTTATMDVTGFQLEYGKVATPFEYRSYQEELALCQRYFEVLFTSTGYSNTCLIGKANTTSQAIFAFPWKVEKRVAPTSAATGTGRLYYNGGVETTSYGFGNFDNGTIGGRFTINSITGSPLTVGQALHFDVNSSPPFIMTVSAEL